ncbi:hypothetical protein ACS0TY_032270 [Phlomoides rotata]
MIHKAIDSGLFDPISVGLGNIHISHLQYADDTILVGQATIKNIWALKCNFANFELLSGLRVNYSKCSLFGTNLDGDLLKDMASFLGCDVGAFPMSYLAIRIGADSGSSSIWDGVIQKMKCRLQNWDDKRISFGCRITLLNAA